MREIMKVNCAEPEGDIVRTVYEMDMTIENLKYYWDKARQFDTLLNKEIQGDFKKFVNLLVYQEGEKLGTKGLYYVIDDFVGVYNMTNMIPGLDAKVHYSFFDRRHKGREDMSKAMMKYIFEEYRFHRLSVEIPFYSKAKVAFNFVVSLGFIYEGRKRSAVKYKDQWFDVHLFGMVNHNGL